jgi:hypothetical protein
MMAFLRKIDDGMARAWSPQIALAARRMHQLCTPAYLSFQSESQRAPRLHNCDGGP